MYVCICNGLKEKDVRHSVRKGATKARDVFQDHGCKPDCAKCVNCMRNIIKDESQPHEILMAAE